VRFANKQRAPEIHLMESDSKESVDEAGHFSHYKAEKREGKWFARPSSFRMK
jgi:hypothetical protein